MKRFVLLWVVFAWGCALTAEPTKPNIIIFLADDLSRGDTSIYGNKDVRTPNLQRLAERGMTFSHAYVASPTCAPSRAALLTGLMPARNGCEPNHVKARPSVKALPACLKESGYDVCAFGKVAHYGHGQHYGLDNIQFESFHDHRGIQAAVEMLKARDRNSQKPLCLFVGTNWPHVPWPENAGYTPAQLQLPPGHVDTVQTREWRAKYLSAVTKCDEDLGTIMSAAEAHLGTNTLFFFSSDNGAQWPFAKWNLYENGIHVPLVATWPGVITPGSQTTAMVSWIDILPTCLDVAGAALPLGLDGRSFQGVFKDPKRAHRAMIFSTHSGDGNMNVYPMRAACDTQWKYIRNLHPEFRFATHIDKGKAGDGATYWNSWMELGRSDAAVAAILKRYAQRPSEELYDLVADPHELRNLAGNPDHADRQRELRAALDAWMKEQGDTERVFGEPTRLNDAPANPR